MPLFSLISGGLGLASGIAGGIFGAINSTKQQRLAYKQQQERDAANQAMFERQYYQDALSRSDTQNMLRRLRNNMKDVTDVQNNVAVITGQTPEAQAATKFANAQTYADAVADIDATNASRKDNALASQQAIRNQSYTDWVNTHSQYANNWSNFASQAFSTGVNSLDTLASGIEGINAKKNNK